MEIVFLSRMADNPKAFLDSLRAMNIYIVKKESWPCG